VSLDGLQREVFMSGPQLMSGSLSKPAQSKHPSSLIAMGLACLLSMLPLVQARPAFTVNGPFAGGLPSSVLDQNSVGWLSVRNMTSSQFSAYFDEKKRDGYMVIDIEVDEIDGEQRVGAVWQRNTDGRGWFEYRNLTSDEFHDKWVELNGKGFRVIDQDAYTLGGRTLWAGVWIENKESLDWASRRNLTDAQFAAEFDDFKNRGFIMVDVEAYASTAGMLYAAVWVRNVEGLDWAEWRNLSDEAFKQKFEEYRSKYRVLDIESYQRNGAQNYAAIWIENKNGRGWAEWRDMTAKGYGDKWLELRDAGYRVIDFEAYPTNAGWRYAGVWRQNSDRPNWVLKDEVDALAEDEAADEDIPGMSIAIARNGTFLYLRGFGHADVDDDIIAHSRTVYRLASVSKAVAGVLGMRLSQQGLFDLNKPSSFYIPGLPAQHTHAVSQTLSNRSGIGHYSTYPDIEGDYDTALAAVQNLWNVPLAYSPGTVYTYSTHAYTFLGASIEGATGQPINNVVRDYITNPYVLTSLRAEDRSVPDKYRASLYNTSNAEVSADDISWKVLGGGLESSAYDLARFGVKVMNGTVLNAASRSTMWTEPNPAGSCNYALGWCTGTEDGTLVVAKDGAQLGSRTYIRLYPDLNIVIVVLTNRKEGGHDPAQLAKDIGALMLDEYLPLTAQMTVQSIQAQKAVEDLDEPAEEALDPALYLYPINSPAAVPTASDKEEVDGWLHRMVNMPVIMR
jgi:CubicO group peptidase (beta-lactamase class C family)